MSAPSSSTHALVTPYLHFDGRCDDAIAFYKTVFNAEVLMLMRFKDSPDKDAIPPGSEDKVMHSRVQIGGSTVLMSDGRCAGKTNFEGFSLSVTVKDEAEAARVFSALSAGGDVRMPLTKTFFSPSFGMAADRFGVSWMVYVQS